MKRKGFTLIELLAVIVILSVIALIATPIITNVIDESKKNTLETSVKGLIKAADYYAIENSGVYEFLFDETHKGTTKQGESLEYKGELEAKGKLYIDEEGDISLCVYNDKYYAYKNYNGGVIIGEKKKDNCEITYDYISNKYIAYLESEGMSSNVYTKEEVNELVQELKNRIEELENSQGSCVSKEEIIEINNNVDTLTNSIQNNNTSINEIKNSYATKEELTNTSNNLTTTINTNKNNIETIKNNYTLKSELNTTNSNLDSLTSIVKNNTNNIDNLTKYNIEHKISYLSCHLNKRLEISSNNINTNIITPLTCSNNEKFTINNDGTITINNTGYYSLTLQAHGWLNPSSSATISLIGLSSTISIQLINSDTIEAQQVKNNGTINTYIEAGTKIMLYSNFNGTGGLYSYSETTDNYLNIIKLLLNIS